ncbi:FAD binding domain-containing protein [Irpex rosettiformis]|uniref:FAD binding domain-containing protein n=1 Tax=Irpex rosettiformis TaxID=378272 RepID=A0ACB8TSC2_9APHY|nr:FAD binding domain-containing protein [Irpex rosettiformis]
MPSIPFDTPILIVGGGPCGLVLALTLAQSGTAFRIIEKEATFHTAQRGTGIQPRSLELFKFLGVLLDIWEGSRLTKYSAIYKMPEGREIATLIDIAPYGDPTPDVPFRTHRNIGQCHTEEILREHLAKYNVSLKRGTELISFSQDGEGITAEVIHRVGDKEETKAIRAQYLVDAGGARSVIRKQLGIPFVGETKEAMRMISTDIQVTGISAERWHQWGDQSSKVVRLISTEYPGFFTLMVGGKDADFATLATSHEALLKFVYEVTNRSPDELQFGETRSFSEFRPNIRLADRYSEGHVFLVGDAAHLNLAWKLSLVVKHHAPPSLLDSYNAERRPVAKDVLSMSSEFMKKTLAFKAGDNPTFAQRPKTLHQLGVNYRFSELVIDEQSPDRTSNTVSAAYRPEDPSVLRAGDRAPDAPGLVPVQLAFGDTNNNVKVKLGETSTTLFDTFKPVRHTALVFVGGMDLVDVTETVKVLRAAPEGTVHVVFVLPKDDTTPGALSGISLSGGVEVLIDVENHAHTFYPPATHGFPVVIVRPDGFVGAVVNGKEGVLRYLHVVFGDHLSL